MASNFCDFIIELAVNPRMFNEFILNPDHVLDKAGLSPEEKAALKSGDTNRIREYIGKELGEEIYCKDMCIWGSNPAVMCITVPLPEIESTPN